MTLVGKKTQYLTWAISFYFKV